MANPLLDQVVAEIFSSPKAATPPMQPQTSGMIKGPGGGLADAVPAEIVGETGEVQPAALSGGEFVFPADVVSMLGDGDSNEGARILQNMINQIRIQKTNTEEPAGELE